MSDKILISSLIDIIKEEFNKIIKEELKKIVEILIIGLTTPGAHHKQYYLEKTLKALTTDEWVNEAKKEFRGLKWFL